MKEPICKWDADNGIAYCTIFDADGHAHEGKAVCAADDADMMNEKTGMEIAYRRAEIKAYKAYKYKIKNKLEALNQLYYSMKHSKKFNPKSYENIMLQRQIRLCNDDLDTANNIISTAQLDLKIYIKAKDELYKQFRELRKSKAK